MVAILAIDVGSTHIKRATVQDGDFLETKRDPLKDISSIAQEISLTELPVALCSVVPRASQLIKAELAAREKRLLIEISSNTANLVSGFYPGMGADRIADAIAGWHLYGRNHPVIVIDLGTATTLTAVKEGKFAGALTTLGLASICNSLEHLLPHLPKVEFSSVAPNHLAFDAKSALSDGTLLAHIALVEQWVKIARQELGSNAVTVGTGGWCQTVANNSSIMQVTDPLLTLKGIWLAAANSAQ